MKCSVCAAKCCALYTMDDDDYREIAENMGIDFELLCEKFPVRTQSMGPVNFCIFLDLKAFECGIYKSRPSICYDYFCKDWENG